MANRRTWVGGLDEKGRDFYSSRVLHYSYDLPPHTGLIRTHGCLPQDHHTCHDCLPPYTPRATGYSQAGLHELPTDRTCHRLVEITRH